MTFDQSFAVVVVEDGQVTAFRGNRLTLDQALDHLAYANPVDLGEVGERRYLDIINTLSGRHLSYRLLNKELPINDL